MKTETSMETLAHVVSAIAGAIIIGGFLLARLKSFLGPSGETLARRIFEEADPLNLALPRTPSLEYLPVPPTIENGLASVSVANIETWDNIPVRNWQKRHLLAVIRLNGGFTIAVVSHSPAQRDHFENGKSYLNYDLVLGMDTRRRRNGGTILAATHPRGIHETIEQCHWVNAGPPVQLEWRRYKATYRVSDETRRTIRHPKEEIGWALSRNNQPLYRGYSLLQMDPQGNLFPFPHYTILENAEGNFQAVKRTIYGRGDIQMMEGERVVHWEGPLRNSFVDAVNDLFRKNEFNCSPVYRRNLGSGPQSFPWV